jgi:queuine/archaeosine tRNA-ribosyltransferase
MILEEWIELQAYIGSYITMNFDTCIDEVKKWSKKRQQVKIVEDIKKAIE